MNQQGNAMKYTIQKNYKGVSGSSLQGYITVNYSKLKSLFGTPMKGDEYKTDAEWVVKFNDGTIATIYNYKDGKNYNGSKGTPKTKITNWHVGGFDKRAFDMINDVIGAE